MNRSLLDKLLDKYYRGATSGEEERMLLDLLSREDLPQQYAEDRILIAGIYDNEDIPEPSAGLNDRILEAIDGSEKEEKKHRNKRILYGAMSAAAGILVIISFWFVFDSRGTGLEDTYQDPQLAYNETMEVLYRVSSNLNKGRASMSDLSVIAETESKMQLLPESRSAVTDELKTLKYLDTGMRLLDIGDDINSEKE
ncbi:MAG: hypothetical protein U5K32_06395 [Bacteroidales bacterium]|nr:hypothetical protein [Bacteroidales bacterium]